MKMKGGTTSNSKIKGKQFEAAIVFDTIQGIHFGAIVVDFSSLYPSIIKLQNIGYSTIRCTHNECQTNIPIPKLSHWVCTKNKSLEALFIGGLRDLRVQHYKQQPKRKDLPKPMISWYKCVEQVIKVFMNGSYGVFSTNNKNDTGKKPDELEQKNKFDGFAFLCPPASELIAGIARMTIIPTAEKAKSLGLVVLGGDTDSLFVLGDRAKVVELCEWAFKTFNIELALDKEPLFMGFSNRKKNYIMVFPDGKHDEKGLTGKKKHTPKFYKGYYERALTTMCDIKSEKDISIARKKMIKITKEGYNKIKEHRWDNLSDLAFHITVGKDIKSYTKTLPQHIKAVQMLEKAGYSFEIGSEVSFVKTLKGKRSNTEGVMPLEIIKNNNQVDVEKYIQLFKTMIEQLLDMFNIDWDSEILGYTKLF
jgi:DNA polymerase I